MSRVAPSREQATVEKPLVDLYRGPDSDVHNSTSHYLLWMRWKLCLQVAQRKQTLTHRRCQTQFSVSAQTALAAHKAVPVLHSVWIVGEPKTCTDNAVLVVKVAGCHLKNSRYGQLYL